MKPIAALPLAMVAGLASAAVLVQRGVVPGPSEVAQRVGAGVRDLFDAPASEVGAAAATHLVGDYVEARDCTVFGGACHINGEVESQGRSALAAWHFTDGATLVAALESVENLGRGGARRSVLFNDGVAPSAVALLAASAGLEVVATHAAPVVWQRDGDRFIVRVEGVLELAGTALVDRSCCSMPQSIWYTPLATVGDGRVVEPIVGNPERCRFSGADGLLPWTYEGDNTVFVGRFDVPLTAP